MMKISERENSTLDFWKKSKIFEKSVERPAGDKPKGDYVFYDGPPFITGLPHYATLLPSIVKDAVPRYWTMKGYRVERKWGWDCHGLPAENQVEKELGLKNKKEIEELGVGKFVDACKHYVNNVSDQWRWYIDKIARWADMENAYRTMNSDFMESVIWSFKELYYKKLIYEGYRTSLHCPRCATPLSKFEITMDAGSYKDVTEPSVIIEFPLKGEKNTSVLAWTTTPWTLPGNLALAVGKNIDYVKIEKKDEGVGDLVRFVLAKEKLKEIFGDQKYKIIKEFKGKKLVGLEYEPLFDLGNDEINDSKKVYKIYPGEFVNTDDGTGIVHIAVVFGEEDFELGQKEGLPVLELMDENGVYTKAAGKEWEGLYFKDAGEKVLKRLGRRLFDKSSFTHSYPFCYRCKTPLIYRAQRAWYLNIDKIRSGLLRTNKKINWVPEYFKEGRFKYNIENAPHWCLSRSRYWGTPLPVWKCEKCEKITVAGSINEIEKLSGKKVTDLHIPKINDHKFKCKCGGTMSRVPEVLDCWFESGSMPYAQWHYPFDKKNDFKKIFPADFIIEYTGQLRGWFYYLHVLSNSLFNSECFKNVVVTGVLAGTDGRKMSKSYGNYPDPKETLEKYGGDAIRMYFLSSPILLGDDMNLSEEDLKNSLKKNVMLLSNIYQFYTLSPLLKSKKSSSKNILDKWISGRLHQLTKVITENMEKYNLPFAARSITEFIDDLSWYIRESRGRFNEDDLSAKQTLQEVLEISSKIMAPFMPFIAEHIWQGLTKNNFKDKNKSVHLEKWPKVNEKKINKSIIENMKLVREIVSLALRERDKIKIGVKWPLSLLKISSPKIDKEYLKLIQEEVNVRKIEYKSSKIVEVEVDQKLTPELEAEGYAREMSRYVQAFRKKLGLVKKDKIELFIVADEKLKEILGGQKRFIQERTNSSNLEIVTTGKERFKKIIKFKIKDKRGWIAII